jgi:hypothetical protein
MRLAGRIPSPAREGPNQRTDESIVCKQRVVKPRGRQRPHHGRSETWNAFAIYAGAPTEPHNERSKSSFRARGLP